jgi:dihydroorotate dehydrogenase
MSNAFDTTGRYLTAWLRLLPAETAHDIGMLAMERGLLRFLPHPPSRKFQIPLQVDIPGIGLLRHPIGLAAGFDKNARCPGAFEHMGLAFIELGTVTPRPQPGNPKPRLFRQPEIRAIINRMGFNSDGAEAVLARLRELNWPEGSVPIGVNVGKNKQTPPDMALDDFLTGIQTFESHARWLTVNVSSPNTPGLRDLATPDFLRDLSQLLGGVRSKCWIKLDPDMSRTEFQDMISSVKSEGFQGVILSNTHRVEWPEAGGQSGHPLLSASNTCLEWAWDVTKGSLPVIATGGVLSGVDAFHKLARGASAVQIYTALVYRGPGAAFRICEELAAELKLRGFASATEAIGSLYS